MRKMILLLHALLIMHAAFSERFTGFPAANKALPFSDSLIQVNKPKPDGYLLRLAKIERKDLEKLTGRKLNIFERLQFKIEQKKIRKAIAGGSTVNEVFGYPDDDKRKFHLGGFLLGFLGAIPLGILIAYLVKDDKRKQRIRWAWIGLASVLSLLLILFVVITIAKG